MTVGSERAADPDPPWRRLSAGMLLVEPVREVMRFIPMLVVLLFAGANNDGGPPWGLIGTGLVIALGITRYLTTRYRITPAVVEVRRGLLQRRHLTVPRDRIRTIDVSAHPLQRVLRLVRMDIGTGSSHPQGASVRLDGLPAASAPGLRAELLHHAADAPAERPSAPGGPDGVVDEAPAAVATRAGRTEVELSALRARWIALAPATLSGVVTGAVLIGFGFRLMREARLDPRQFGPVRQVLGFLRGQSVWLDVGLAVAAVLVVVVLLSVLGYVLSYWGFRLTRHPGGTLQISRGLLTTRSTSITERRLVGVQRREPLVLRWARGARLHAVATGLRRPGGEDSGGSSLLMPPAPVTEVLRIESIVLGDEHLTHAPLAAHGPAARRRRYIRALVGAAAFAAGLAALTRWAELPASLYPLVVLAAVVGGVLLAADRYRNLGHAIVDRHLVVRLGSLHRRRTVVAIDGVVGVTIRQSWFQRRAGLATLIATTAAGAQHYDVPDLPARTAMDVAAALVPACVPLTTAGGTTPARPISDDVGGSALLRAGPPLRTLPAQADGGGTDIRPTGPFGADIAAAQGRGNGHDQR
jgi:putative membrane protein